MHVIAGFTLIPIGGNISLSPYIALVERVLEASGLNFKMHANGTDLEGEWNLVFETLEKCHAAVHAEGVPRIHTVVQFGTRTDREQKMQDKMRSIEQKRPTMMA